MTPAAVGCSSGAYGQAAAVAHDPALVEAAVLLLCKIVQHVALTAYDFGGSGPQQCSQDQAAAVAHQPGLVDRDLARCRCIAPRVALAACGFCGGGLQQRSQDQAAAVAHGGLLCSLFV